MDKEDVLHMHKGILLSHKKDEIMSFEATLMNLEIITYMWNLRYNMNLSVKQR